MIIGLRLSLLVISGLVVFATGLRAGEESDVLFATRVLPLFQERCLGCHGKKADEIKADYDMRTSAGAFKGGASGEAAIIPGKPQESPLYLAVTRANDDWSAMPPKDNDKLSTEQIGWIKQWIAAGAVWPDEKRLAEVAKRADMWNQPDGVTVATVGGLSPDWTNRRYNPAGLWAYRPVKRPAVNVDPGQNPIDVLIAARLPCAPASRADRRTLIRRATFDLIGLPPTPEDIREFVNDARDDRTAFAAVVERLLKSPHYGEHWARHWLDVVRYADSSGFSNDYGAGMPGGIAITSCARSTATSRMASSFGNKSPATS